MITVEEITEAILLAKGYQAELTEDLLEQQKAGCMDCRDQKDINRIENLVVSLENRLFRLNLGEDTVNIYNCLLLSIANYNEGKLSIDPNSSVPSVIIDVTIISDGKPDGINIFYDDMSGDNGSGGKTTYSNPLWIGWYPQMQTAGVVELFQYRDYNYDVTTGTFTLLIDAESGVTGIYEGGSIRVTDYNKTGDTPPVNVFTYKLVNDSEIDTEYTLQSVVVPLVAGQTIENPIIIGQAIGAQVMDGQTCTYTIYDAEGAVIYTVTIIGEGFINGNAMLANQNQEFIYSDVTYNITITNALNDDITVYYPTMQSQLIPSQETITLTLKYGDIVRIGSDSDFKIDGQIYTTPNEYEYEVIADKNINVVESRININYYGDSLTVGVGTSASKYSYPNQTSKKFEGYTDVTSYVAGFSGQTARWFIDNQLNNQISLWDNTKAQLSIVFFGANDLCQDAGVAADFYDAMTELCQALQNAGSQVIVIPVLSRKDTFAQGIAYANITRRNDFNNWLDLNYSTFSDSIVDRTLANEIYSDNAPDNIYWFRKNDVDGLSAVHMTDLGAFVMAQIVGKAIFDLTGIVVGFNPPSLITDSNWIDTVNSQVQESNTILKTSGYLDWDGVGLWDKKIELVGSGLQATLNVPDIISLGEFSQMIGFSKKIGSFDFPALEYAFYWDNNSVTNNPHYTVYESGTNIFGTRPLPSEPYSLKIELYSDSVKYYVDDEMVREVTFNWDIDFVYVTCCLMVNNGSRVKNATLTGNLLNYNVEEPITPNAPTSGIVD